MASELRQRKTDNKTSSEEEFNAHKFLPSLVTEKLGPILEHAGPVLNKAAVLLNEAQPYLEKAYDYGLQGYKVIEPYHELVPIVLGLLMVFFGGHFMTTMAAIEAYNLCGWRKTRRCLGQLYESYKLVLAANKEDNLKDEDGDGVKDVHQISKRDLLSRKLFLFFRTADPDKISNALLGIYQGFMGVIATLRVQFAQAITLGVVLGETFAEFADEYFTPMLKKVIPEEQHKWIPTIINYGCKTIGVSIAWFIQRVISSFYSSIRGAKLVVQNGLALRERMVEDSTKINASDVQFVGAVGVLAFLGFYWQLSSFYSLPFPFNVILLPVRFVENMLIWFVAVDQYHQP